MTLPLELGGIQNPEVRRALEVLSQQFPVAATGGGGGAETDPVASPALATHAALTTGAHGGIVASTDPRLTDARAPTAHKTTHEPGGSDALTGLTNASIAAAAGIAKTKLANLDIVNADVNAAAAIAEAKLNLATDAAAGTGSRRTLGTGALQAAAGNDARLSDARTPTAHTHPAADVVSGVLATARLGSGTPAASTYVDGGTGAWTALPAGGGSSGVDGTTGAFSAYRAAASSLTTGTVVPFDTKDFDVSGWMSVAGTIGYTPQIAGYYRLSWSVSVGTLTADNWVQANVYKNGTLAKAGQLMNWRTAAAGGQSTGTAIVQANGTTDIFDIRLTHNQGATVALFVGATSTYFQGEMIGAANLATAWTAIPRQAADVTNATVTLANTDLVFTFAANSTYLIDLYLLATSAATTTGYALAFDVSAAVTAAGLTFEHQLAAAGTLTGGDSIADGVARSLSSGVPTAAALVPILGKGIVVSGANTGTCRLQFAPEVAASATFKAGSTMRVMKAA